MKTKEKFHMLGTELKNIALRLGSGDVSVLTKSDRVVVVIAAVFSILMFATSFCFGANLIDGIGDTFKSFYTKLFGISTIVAAVAIIIGCLWVMLSPTSRGAQVPIDWIKKVILFYILILILGGVFGVIKDMTAGQSDIW